MVSSGIEQGFGNAGEAVSLPFGQPNLDPHIQWATDGFAIYAVYALPRKTPKAYRVMGQGLFEDLPQEGYHIVPQRSVLAVNRIVDRRGYTPYHELPWWFQADRMGPNGWRDKLYTAMTGKKMPEQEVKR